MVDFQIYGSYFKNVFSKCPFSGKRFRQKSFIYRRKSRHSQNSQKLYLSVTGFYARNFGALNFDLQNFELKKVKTDCCCR